MSTATFATFAARCTHAALLRLSAQLRRASKHPGDAETIHDLRVSIRRYTQCLRTFEDLFDPGRVGRIRKRLRALMTCCGEVRNCDIAVELLRAARLPGNNPAHASLRARRAGAEAALVEHLGKKRWANFARRNRLRLNPNPSRAQAWDVDGSVAANAHAFLPPMCADFFAAGCAAAASREDFETLHQFRLRAKRFRYTLELFGDVYGPGRPGAAEQTRRP
jgi:CHAD domain-containing protein